MVSPILYLQWKIILSFSKETVNSEIELTVLDHHVKKERLIEMPDEKEPNESDSVLRVKRVDLPEYIAEWVLEETSDVLKSSPFLGHVSGLSSCVHELAEVSISLLGQSSIDCVIQTSKECYLPIISALSLMLGTP